jgi:hypothetical protein
MRQGSALIVCLMMLTILFVAPVFADRTTEDLQSKILERFDTPSSSADANSKYEYAQNHRWDVRGSKFITEGYPKFNWIPIKPEALPLPDGSAVGVLGVQFAFDRLGYNFLEFIPVADQNGADGKPVPTGIAIPGRVKNLDMWVWGSNFNFYLDVHLRDYRGMIHVLRLGDINYKGWRNLKIDIPSSIPQDVKYVPARKSLELVKIVMWTRPEETVTGGLDDSGKTVPLFVYLDHIKVITDMFENPFDGSTLADPEKMAKVWAAAGDQKK